MSKRKNYHIKANADIKANIDKRKSLNEKLQEYARQLGTTPELLREMANTLGLSLEDLLFNKDKFDLALKTVEADRAKASEKMDLQHRKHDREWDEQVRILELKARYGDDFATLDPKDMESLLRELKNGHIDEGEMRLKAKKLREYRSGETYYHDV